MPRSGIARLYGSFRASQMVLVVKNPPASTGDMRCEFSPSVGKIPWRRACNPLQYSCLGIPMDRGAWQTTVHGVTKSQTGLSTTVYLTYWNVAA